MLLKGVYPYEYMDDWEKFNETLPEDFYSHVNVENITDADFRRISWFVCSKPYFTVSTCIWELSKYVS